MTAAEKFAYHMADRVLRDPRVAYHVGPYSRSLELLTEAYAEISGRQLDEVRADFNARIKTERPACPECTHCRDQLERAITAIRGHMAHAEEVIARDHSRPIDGERGRAIAFDFGALQSWVEGIREALDELQP